MAKYRKLPVEVEAMQYTGDNKVEILNNPWFIGRGVKLSMNCCKDGYDLIIQTLEGDRKAIVGDYIIKGVKGEFYPCKPDVFKQTYAPVV